MGCDNSKKVLESVRGIRNTVLDRLGRIENETKEMKDQIQQIRQVRKKNTEKNVKEIDDCKRLVKARFEEVDTAVHELQTAIAEERQQKKVRNEIEMSFIENPSQDLIFFLGEQIKKERIWEKQ